MLHFTQIARQSDALALAADTESGGNTDPNIEKNKVAAKNLLRRLSSNSTNPSQQMGGYNPAIPQGGGPGAPPVCLTVEASSYNYHILIEGGVLFLTLCDASSPANHAYAYLADVSREFLQQYGNNIDSYTRPYACIKFDSYLQKTKKVFGNSHARGTAMAMPGGGKYPVPVKRLYREVMGIADPSGNNGPSSSGRGGSGGSSLGKGASDNTLIVVGASVAVCVVLFVLLVLYYLW